MVNLSYAFTPLEIDKKIILRPMLPVTLKYSDIEFPTTLLIDSGADYSMLRREIVEDVFQLNINDLERAGITEGIAGKTDVAILNVEIIFGRGDLYFKEKIPFRIPIDPNKDVPISLLGRDPFFSRYRIDFRMGYTTDPALGKFVIYPEKHKRSAEKFTHPFKITKHGKK